jgi:hypothetical protein
VADVRKPALAVIGQDHEARVGEHAVEIVELAREDLAGGGRLEVDPQELLLASDDAQLHGRAQRRVAQEARLHAVGRKQPRQRMTGLVVAGDR